MLDELADLRKRFDRRHRLVDLRATQAQQLAIQVNVFASREFRVETRAQFQQRGDTSARHNPSRSGLQDAADDLQQRTLAASVRSHQRKHFAALHFEADVLESPEIGMARLGTRKHFVQAIYRPAIEAIKLGDILYKDQIQS
jgi:hypothetical protein